MKSLKGLGVLAMDMIKLSRFNHCLVVVLLMGGVCYNNNCK